MGSGVDADAAADTRIRPGQFRSGVAVPAEGRAGRRAPRFPRADRSARSATACRMDLRPWPWSAAGHAAGLGSPLRRVGQEDLRMSSLSQLLEKYDVPVPRYTSYPAVPNWQAAPSPDQWFGAINAALQPSDASLAVYIHLPFCETL